MHVLGDGSTTAKSGQRHVDFMQLQDHSDDFTPEDRRDWLKALRFLQGALGRAAFPGRQPPPAELLGYVGRIAANNFG